MKPIVKVLIVVAVTLVVIQIIKRHTGPDRDVEPFVTEPFIRFIATDFETVAPQPFQVTNVPLVVNDDVTATPVLTEVATELPAVAPTMVPTFMPTVLPALVQGTDGTGMPVTVAPTPYAAQATVAPVLSFVPTATPSLIRVQTS